MGVPTVTGLNSKFWASGLFIALACDQRVMSNTAQAFDDIT